MHWDMFIIKCRIFTDGGGGGGRSKTSKLEKIHGFTRSFTSEASLQTEK